MKQNWRYIDNSCSCVMDIWEVVMLFSLRVLCYIRSPPGGQRTLSLTWQGQAGCCPVSQDRVSPPCSPVGRGFTHIGVLVLIILIHVVGPVALLSRVPEPLTDSSSGGQVGAIRGERGGGIAHSIVLWQLLVWFSGAFSFQTIPIVSVQAQTGGRCPGLLLREGKHLQRDKSTRCLIKDLPREQASQ